MPNGSAIDARFYGPQEVNALLLGQKVIRPTKSFLDYAGVEEGAAGGGVLSVVEG
ncbi:hypothetical protein [uncultured Desulfuromonas sp.]|nr:hypothetical protein [uncultured Desulfuromonas sp.]